MGDLNRTSLMGRLGADPEIRTTQAGDKVASFRMATGERWKDRNTGEQKERTEWHSIVVFGPLVNVVEKHLAKGRRVMVEGTLRTRKWQAQDGSDRWTTEVVVSGFGANLYLIDFAEGNGGAARGQDEAYGGGQVPSVGGYDAPPRSPAGDIDDEIPF
jgi:single-strand DNA-binding protein